ncbi:peptidoglycan -binding protein [Sulfitobacter delicatus]|uniref:Chemotaxis protein MotB n=1 Tax=Sulfitobacter delicatus TaxID=218672 RepID=A0A1G7VQL7_9RHOB|nr:peptidoglycan -binding protein [Sulfitobacter delicatus]SDG62095.1 chemotaxis protein MotB [Sulfitobacter delicatus]
MALSRRTGARFQASIWPGFVDAMTGLLLVLMFVLTIFMVVQFVLTERISGQESELNALAGEVAALAQALGVEERTTARLEARLGALNASLNDAREEVSRQEAVIAGLTAERDEQDAALQAAEAKITGFEARVAALLASQAEDRTRIGALEDREAELLDEQEALNVALSTARDEIDAQTEAARLAAAKREALDALVADLRAQNADAEAEVAALNAEVAETQEALSEEEAARLAEAAAAQALREKLENADAELTAMTLALEEQRKRAEDTLTLLAAARAAESDLDTQLAEALLRMENLEQTSESLDAEREALRAQQEALNAQLEAAEGTEGELRARLAEAEVTKNELNRRLAEALSRVQALEEQGEALSGDQADLRERLAQALAAKLAAETLAEDKTTAAERRAALLAQAEQTLAEEKAVSAEAQRQTELLNQQVAELRAQLGNLQALLDDAVARDAAKSVELQSLGSELNTALARVAAEERRRAELEAAERKRLEEETKDLAQYRSEFFGRLRDLLGTQEGVRIEGDRFVFSSEVLFAPGSAVLSQDGKGEIAKVAGILRSVVDDIPAEIDWVIRVDGHTDNVPLSGRGEFADNWELSQARALSVVKYMINFLGIAPDRLAANGFGQYQPVATGSSEEARAQNRRIELKFTEK